jgi:glycosyltransferase involved in cell wall biosynthesis
VMKILFLGTYADGECLRGPEKVARRLVDELHLLGQQVSFIEYYSSGERYNYRDKLFNLSNIHTASGVSVRRMGIVPLLYHLSVNRYDVVHVITFERFAIVAFLLKPLCRFKIFITVHGIVRHQNLYYRKKTDKFLFFKDSFCEYIFMRFADCLCFLSEQSKTIASLYYPINMKQVRIVSNGVDDAFRITKRKSKPDSQRISILFIGDPERPEKGYSFFMDTLQRYTCSADVYILCEQLPADTIREQGSMTIHYLKKMCTTEYASFLQDKDIYVNASSYESFSISAVEAMSMGLVPIVTGETGMSRYIRDGENGFIITYGDKSALLHVLERLSVDAALRRSVSNEATNIFPLLTWKNIAQEYMKHYLCYSQKKIK